MKHYRPGSRHKAIVKAWKTRKLHRVTDTISDPHPTPAQINQMYENARGTSPSDLSGLSGDSLKRAKAHLRDLEKRNRR